MATNAIIGVWTDYSQDNHFLGWTLTLSSPWGPLLTSTQTVLIGFAGAAVWSITAFIIHQWRVTSTLSPSKHQAQVLLRNTQSAPVTVWTLLCMSCTWRKASLLYLGIAPALIAAIFILAGVFVVKVASPASEVNNVRIRSDQCGTVNVSSASTFSEAQAFAGKNANDSRVAATYVDTCYHTNAGLGCAVLPKQFINVTSTLTQCPFDDQSRCTQQPLRLDSGYMNSNKDLGINTADHVDVRMVTTCSVITVKDVVDERPDESSIDSVILLINLGPILGVSNWTYPYPSRYVNSSLGYTVS